MNRLPIFAALLGIFGTGLMRSQSVAGQVVQLPSIHTFSYSGSVLVPDSGQAHLAGNMRAASSYPRRGWQRGMGSATGAGQAAVSATIIDHAQIDRRLLGDTPEQFMRRQGPRSPSQHAADPDAEGKSLVRHARAMCRQGNKSAARASYQLAIESLSGRLQQLAKQEYQRAFPRR